MINKAELLRQNNERRLEQTLEQHLQNYFRTVGLKYKLKWEVRSEQQIVSCCFSLSQIPDLEVVLEVLKQSEMFNKVGIVQSKIQQGKFRILIQTDNVINLVYKFQHAEYFNALLRVLPVSGILCVPSSRHDKLTIQACAPKNSIQHVPTFLKLSKLPSTISLLENIEISCTDVAFLIAQHKQLCLNYLVESVQSIDASIKIYGQEIKTECLSSSHHSVFMNFSNNPWATTPALIFEFQKNPTTLKMLTNLHSGLLEFKINGYYDESDALVPCGIRVNHVINIPSIIKNDLALPMIRQSRNNYTDTLLIFKGKTSGYGIPGLPYDISKQILLKTNDEVSSLSEEDKSKYIDKLSSFSL
ncbi:hypothetical protein [uncultured Legionella sp.]|uniref:hypothetical protein n=1 Tax=uncultured Legionella sp. TaxID=210934 RepID=UPI00260D1D9C|nr:hypothetical protein [uncultured Legionella sp.]